jgi:YYY domain-containing protein
MTTDTLQKTKNKTIKWGDLGLTLILILIILAGGYLRLVGVDWDEGQHMHPDERFLSMVWSAISPVERPSEYFDTSSSSLNPANRGHSFFVYGTLPIFIVRYVGEAVGQTGYGPITILGRQISAIFDLFTILLVFFIGKGLYNKWVGLLGALFYALAVLPIQLSHYATVDVITNTFAYLTVYAGVWALIRKRRKDAESSKENSDEAGYEFNLSKLKGILRELTPYIFFGVALGAATASKINAVTLALILPLVEGMRYLNAEPENRRELLPRMILNLIVAAVLSFLTFRVFQPYAFNGPGFFNMGLNEGWFSSLQSLRTQSSGDVDFPPALQWARRPITFSWENMVRWGLGLPLGLFATFSFLWMGYLILRKRDWCRHLPLWAFTGLYFSWQSISWVRSMRYQTLIYPAFALFAGWGLVRLLSAKKGIKLWLIRVKPKLIRIAGAILTVVIIVTTAAWAYMFSRIYPQTHTRVAASRWIYQNIPGPLTLKLDTDEGEFQQPLPYRAGDAFTSDMPYTIPFYAVGDGLIQSVTFPYILDTGQTSTIKQINLSIHSPDSPDEILASGTVESAFLPSETDDNGTAYEFLLMEPLSVYDGDIYYVTLNIIQDDVSIRLEGSPSMAFLTEDGMAFSDPLPRIMESVSIGDPYNMNIRIVKSGVIREVYVPHLVDLSGAEGTKDLTLTFTHPEKGQYSAHLESDFVPGEDIRGKSYTFELEQPFKVQADQVIAVNLSTESPGVRLTPYALSPVLESSWDDAVPYPVDGFGPYGAEGGIYQEDLNFEMYWADDESKLARLETNLDLADYIFISSSRQWGTTTRVPERYLLTTFYYRNLLGCPADKDVEWCYSVAEPGMFEGTLGFELVQTFQSNPTLDGIEINTQFAEEAFTVYDHPKVFVFKKTEAYDPIEVRQLLRSVDLSQVVYFTPGDASDYHVSDIEQLNEPRYNLMLPEDRLAEQWEGGTWSELFNRDSLINNSQVLATAVFYLFITLLGFICYPLVRIALPGLDDRGYPLSKLVGMLILAFVAWILGSLGVAFTKTTILFVLIGMALVSAVLIFLQRHLLWTEIKTNWRYYLTVEVLALIAFVFFLLVRLGNPDLWHPYKGGEKPMDFSYLNAVLKSTTFPPYDPWFAGGYINYYYYGFVILGVPIKFLGIVPAVAYNIILPIWYSILILGAFSVGWNQYQGIPRPRALRVGEKDQKRVLTTAFWVGLATAVGLAVLGNLGTVKLIVTTFQKIAAAGAAVDEAGFFQKISWTIQGFVQFIQGTPMPLYPGDWYWYPSRVIPGEPITEFPYFSFIYADLHAHLIALPITVLVISWCLSVVLSKARWGEKDERLRLIGTIVGFTLGGLVIGALRPTNTWDFYTYTVFASIALLYSILRHYHPRLNLKLKRGRLIEKMGVALLAVMALVSLSVLLYQPFSYWFRQGYTNIEIWKGDRTPLNSYLTHWGLFLFVIASWMGWETYHWLKTTPQSALKFLKPYQQWINAGLIFFLILLLALLILGVSIALVAIPLGLWAVILMLRQGCSDGRRFLLFMIGTAVTLTLVVELIYLPGDIGRMNTVFKFYLEAWILFALSAGVCLGWVVKSLRYWNNHLEFFWQGVLFLLVASATLFTLMGTADKIRDRMATDAPHTLDGMSYMEYATYYDMGVEMVLEEDYQVIKWMQENIEGSPVILEGQAYEYRWGNRYTIYTGLPGVVGWNWHQRQQRAILRSNIVQERVDAVGTFYLTEDLTYVMDFIEEYDVSYIILGQLERAFFPGPGLDKFAAYESQLWEEVFRYESTIVYEVLD